MNPVDSQVFESYVPVYDTVPEKWEEGRQFLIEHLKKISNAINIREIGWFLDEELLSGKQFIPPAVVSGQSNQYRTILRKVVDCGALVAGVNPPKPHGVVFDANFTLIDFWVAATNSTTLIADTFVYDQARINGANIIITSPGVYNRSFAILEYIQEL